MKLVNMAASHIMIAAAVALFTIAVCAQDGDSFQLRAQEAEAETVTVGENLVQQLICDYHNHSIFNDFAYLKVTAEMLNNGSVRCTLLDETLTLSCAALLKFQNVSDEFGNFSVKLGAPGQGCWTQAPNIMAELHTNHCTATQREGAPHDMEGFCSCKKDGCNRLDNLRFLPFVDETTAGDIIKRGGDYMDSQENIIWIVVLILVLLLVSAAISVTFYIIRKKRLNKARALQHKMEQYNYEMRMYSEVPPIVNFDDMILGPSIHKGRFGDVYKATLNDKEVCVKYFHPQQRPLFYTEKEIYGVLNPTVRTVVHCLACDERTNADGTIQYIVVMEYLSLGSLAMYLKANTLSWREMCAMAQTAAAGLGYLHGETLINGCHKHAIVHRDINSRNILVRADRTCAIADMGFSMKIRGSKVIRNGTEEHAEDGALRDVGTVRYMAPEILDCAVNLRDCESSLKQIDMYAFSLVLWELLTRCQDILFETKRFMLPFEEELGTHPGFEVMRIHVAKEHNRPRFPVNIKHSDATHLLRETIEECWDTDAEARLSALCVEERFKDMDVLMEHKGAPSYPKNETCYEKRVCYSSTDLIYGGYRELSPLLETDTPASESNVTTITNLDTPETTKPDVNIELERDRLLGPTRGRNIIVERNTLQALEEGDCLAVHENTLIPVEEAKVRQAAEEERSKRQREEHLQIHQPSDGNRVPRPPTRTVPLDVHNEVRDQSQKVKENNLNVRRHNSQRNVYESSTSSNGGAGMVLTIPDCGVKPDRPKSLNLNIKPEST